MDLRSSPFAPAPPPQALSIKRFAQDISPDSEGGSSPKDKAGQPGRDLR